MRAVRVLRSVCHASDSIELGGGVQWLVKAAQILLMHLNGVV
jgi:hypothetical protein